MGYIVIIHYRPFILINPELFLLAQKKGMDFEDKDLPQRSGEHREIVIKMDTRFCGYDGSLKILPLFRYLHPKIPILCVLCASVALFFQSNYFPNRGLCDTMDARGPGQKLVEFADSGADR